MSAQERQFDDIDLLLCSTLQQQGHAKETSNRAWVGLRERIEHERQAEQATLARSARPNSYYDIGWQVRCHWHAIELTLSLNISPVR